MKTTITIHGVTIVVSTITVMGIEESMAFMVNAESVYSDEIACVKGPGSHEKCLSVLERLTVKKLLAIFDSRPRFIGFLYGFEDVYSALKVRRIEELLIEGEIVELVV